jgi:hypothetical protein
MTQTLRADGADPDRLLDRPDRRWTDELTVALQVQTALGVEPTGGVDAATLAAFQQRSPPCRAASLDRPADRRAHHTAFSDDGPTAAPRRPSLSRMRASPDSHRRQRHDLYLFTPDAQGAPTCTDAPARPPLLVTDAAQVTAATVSTSLLATVDHPSGLQVTYNGWPLLLLRRREPLGNQWSGPASGLFRGRRAGNQIPPA